jgi:nicotinamide mononucleotide (NMN) deamidase PncC
LIEEFLDLGAEVLQEATQSSDELVEEMGNECAEAFAVDLTVTVGGSHNDTRRLTRKLLKLGVSRS